MNPQAKSDTSLASCVHCATPLNPSARVCPCCGEDPSADGGLADASWFEEAPANTPNDHVLEAMMAIAAAKPKAAHPALGPFLQPGPPALVQAPSVTALPQQASALSHASPLRLPSSLSRRVLGAGAAVTALAALTAVLLNANGFSLGPGTAPKTGAALVSAGLSPAPGTAAGERDHEAVPDPEPAPPLPALPQASPPARADDEARTIAAALGLGARAEPVVAAPEPRVVPRAAPAADAPGDTESSKRCGEALAALSLCREP